MGLEQVKKSEGEEGSDYSMLDNEWTAWEAGIFPDISN